MHGTVESDNHGPEEFRRLVRSRLLSTWDYTARVEIEQEKDTSELLVSPGLARWFRVFCSIVRAW